MDELLREIADEFERGEKGALAKETLATTG